MILNNSARRRGDGGAKGEEALGGECEGRSCLIIRRLRLARLPKYALSSRGGHLSDPDTIPPLPDAPRDPRTVVSTVSPDYSRSSAGRNCRTRPGSARRRADYEAVRYRSLRVFQRSPMTVTSSLLRHFISPWWKLFKYFSVRHVTSLCVRRKREKERRSNVTLYSAASHRPRFGSRCISASEMHSHINFHRRVGFRETECETRTNLWTKICRQVDGL